MSEVTPKSLFREAKEVLRGGRDRKDNSPIGPVLSYIDNLQKKSPPVQMAVGGVAGLTTGYLFTKGSKMTATVLGVTLITFQAFFDSFRAESRPNLQILVVSASYMNTGFGSRALDASGKPVGREDDDQKKGYSPEYSARTIVEATRNRKTELILAPFSQKFAIFLRWFFPDLLFYLLHRRSLKDPIALEEKKQQ